MAGRESLKEQRRIVESSTGQGGVRISPASARPTCYCRAALPLIKKERCSLQEWRPRVRDRSDLRDVKLTGSVMNDLYPKEIVWKLVPMMIKDLNLTNIHSNVIYPIFS